jgi:O-antigen ligase
VSHRVSWSDPQQRYTWPWLLAALVLFLGAGVTAFLLPPFVFAALLAASAIALTWLVLPEAVIAGLLLARSSVDGLMELFTLFAGSPLSMNLAGAVNSLAVGLGFLVLVQRLLRRQPLLVAGPGWAYGLFLLVSLISIPGSVDPAGGLKEWARLASGLAIFLMVAGTVKGERHARRFVTILLISSLVPLAAAAVQQLTGGGYFFLGFVGTEFAHRPQGTFGHPAALGSYLVILLTLAASVYFAADSAWLKTRLLLWAGVATAGLVLTLARTQWLGMMVAALLVGMVKQRRLVLLVAAVALVLVLTVPLLRERLTASDSVVWRLDLWQAAASLAWPPTLAGRGLGTSPWYINQALPKVDAPPHNDYLKVGMEMGLLGWLAYGIWLLALVSHAWRAYRRALTAPIAWRALGLLAIVVAGAAMSLSDNYSGYTAVQWYLWALVALVPAGGRWPANSEQPVTIQD